MPSRRGSSPTAASIVAKETIKTLGSSGLIHGFTLSTTTHSNNQPPDPSSIGYEVCGYAAKDHLKINEGEGKERPVNSPINVVKLILKSGWLATPSVYK